MLRHAHDQFVANVRSLTLEEALFAAGGYRSILGVTKHLGCWVHVYRSYAFDATPAHVEQTSWPRGLRDRIDPSEAYLREVVAWVEEGLDAWEAALANLTDTDLARPHPLHWGGRAPLADIVVMVAHHVAYHTGELNMLLSIARGEAWEYTEEVEENHISTLGHGVRPPWMSDEEAARYEAAVRRAAAAEST
jgi:hypothetical protein